VENLRADPSLYDTYHISQGLLDPFRVPTENYVPWETPFSFYGTMGPWNEEEVRRAFAEAGVVEVGDSNDSRLSAPSFFALPVTGVTSAPLMSGTLQNVSGALPEPAINTRQEVWTLKVTKVGTLQRKDDTIEGGKRAPSRKWREWTVILTGSQLLFFRDPAWAQTFLNQDDSAETPSTLLRPDELLSVKDAVAVQDRLYFKVRKSVLRSASGS
jgi:hypothetical protein